MNTSDHKDDAPTFPRSFLEALRINQDDEGNLPKDSFAQGVLDLIDEKRLDGLGEPSIRGGYVYPGAAMLRVLPAGIPSSELSVKVLREYIRDALSAGYAPLTIAKQHLGLVRLVMQHAGLRNTTRETKKRTATLLAPRPLPPEIFTADELGDIFERMATYRCTNFMPKRWKHVAILRLAATRAIRSLELSRIRVETDIDLERRILYVRSAKVSGHPRKIHLSDVLVEDIKELVGGRTEGPLVEGGERAINVASQSWQRRLAEPRLTMRNLRRSCASALDAQGAPLAVVRDVLGHSRNSSATLLYLGTTEERTRVELSALDSVAAPETAPGAPPSPTAPTQRRWQGRGDTDA